MHVYFFEVQHPTSNTNTPGNETVRNFVLRSQTHHNCSDRCLFVRGPDAIDKIYLKYVDVRSPQPASPSIMLFMMLAVRGRRPVSIYVGSRLQFAYKSQMMPIK